MLAAAPRPTPPAIAARRMCRPKKELLPPPPQWRPTRKSLIEPSLRNLASAQRRPGRFDRVSRMTAGGTSRPRRQDAADAAACGGGKLAYFAQVNSAPKFKSKPAAIATANDKTLPTKKSKLPSAEACSSSFCRFQFAANLSYPPADKAGEIRRSPYYQCRCDKAFRASYEEVDELKGIAKRINAPGTTTHAGHTETNEHKSYGNRQ